MRQDSLKSYNNTEYEPCHKKACQMVKVLKFQTPLSFCSQIKRWLSNLEINKILFRIIGKTDQTASLEPV